MTTIAPTKTEITAELERLKAEDTRLAEAVAASGTEREKASKAIERAEEGLRMARAAHGRLNNELARVNREIKLIDMPAVLRIVEGGALDLSGFDKWHPLRDRAAVLGHALTVLSVDVLPEKEEMVLFTREQSELAIANMIDCECDRRDWHLNTLLASAVAAEGELVIDRDNTATGELRREAAQHRLAANTLREQIIESQRKRANR